MFVIFVLLGVTTACDIACNEQASVEIFLGTEYNDVHHLIIHDSGLISFEIEEIGINRQIEVRNIIYDICLIYFCTN